MTKPTIITFSGQARHGKDTAVQILYDILTEHGKNVLRINYTDYLKYAASQYLNWDGNKDEKGRSFLQYLGVEKVQHQPTFWVDTVIRMVHIIGDGFDCVLIGDCRFEHDIRRWEEEGYRVFPIHIERLGFDNGLTAAQKNHATETSLRHFTFARYVKASDLYELEKEIIEKIVPNFI